MPERILGAHHRVLVLLRVLPCCTLSLSRTVQMHAHACMHIAVANCTTALMLVVAFSGGYGLFHANMRGGGCRGVT
jgi:hypothetical protein